MIGAAMVKNIRRTGIPASKHGKPNPEYPGGVVYDRRSADTLAAGQYAAIDVDDPLEPGAKLNVLRQMRGDPLARLHAHKQIDEAQYRAGRLYQQDKETADRGARAIDPTKEAVDGGRLPEPLTDRQIKARKRIIRIEGELGRRLTRVLHAVLIDKQSFRKITGTTDQTALKLHGNLFRTALNELAEMYGLANAEARAEA